MFAIIRTRWQTRPLSRRAKRRSSATPGSLRKKYAGIVHPPNMVRLPNHSTISGDDRKPVLVIWVGSIAKAVPEEIKGKDCYDNADDRKHQPRIERHHTDVLSFIEQYSPTRHRRPQPEAEERERGLAKDHARDHQGCRGDQVAHKTRQQVSTDDARRPRPHEYSGGTKILLAQRQELGSHGSGEMGPFNHTEDQCNADIDEDRTPAHRQDRRKRHPQPQMRKRLDYPDSPFG